MCIYTKQRTDQIHSFLCLASHHFRLFGLKHLPHILPPFDKRLVSNLVSFDRGSRQEPLRQQHNGKDVFEQGTQGVLVRHIMALGDPTRLSLLSEFLVRPKQAHAKPSSRNDMQTQPHRPSRNIVDRARGRHMLVPDPAGQHSIPLVQALEPHEMVVAFRERRRSDLAMVSPDLTFGADNILAVEIDGAVDFYGFGEVVTAGHNLGYRVCICYV